MSRGKSEFIWIHIGLSLLPPSSSQPSSQPLLFIYWLRLFPWVVVKFYLNAAFIIAYINYALNVVESRYRLVTIIDYVLYMFNIIKYVYSSIVPVQSDEYVRYILAELGVRVEEF